MTDLVRIDDEVLDADDFVKILKLTGRYESLIDDIVKDKLAVHSARKQGISVSTEEIQERADQLRRVRGLHRAVDMNNWLDSMKISLDDLEKFIVEMLYHEKIMEQVVSDEAVEEYFQLNSPSFDSIEISHILLDSEGKARELMAILEEEPESFAMMAKEHSVADTGSEGGYVGGIQVIADPTPFPDTGDIVQLFDDLRVGLFQFLSVGAVKLVGHKMRVGNGDGRQVTAGGGDDDIFHDWSRLV